MHARRRIGNGDVGDLRSRVRAILGSHVGGRPPTASEVAGELRMSARTMQRRLQELGTSYRRLLEAAHRERAERALRDRSTSVADVAARLGFTEPANFCRAFRRWTGKSPGAFRRSAGAR